VNERRGPGEGGSNLSESDAFSNCASYGTDSRRGRLGTPRTSGTIQRAQLARCMVQSLVRCGQAVRPQCVPQVGVRGARTALQLCNSRYAHWAPRQPATRPTPTTCTIAPLQARRRARSDVGPAVLMRGQRGGARTVSYQRADAMLARKWARSGADACQIHWDTPLCAADHRCARHSSTAALSMFLVYSTPDGSTHSSRTAMASRNAAGNACSRQPVAASDMW